MCGAESDGAVGDVCQEVGRGFEKCMYEVVRYLS